MRRLHLVYAAATLLVLSLASACATKPTPAATKAETAAAPTTIVTLAVEEKPAPEETVEFEDRLEGFNPDNFDDPTNIDNQWLPMKPGMQYVYAGVTEEGGASIPHRVIITITDLTKVIDGVHVVVTWDQDFSAGLLVETELALFAQDNDGNVWRLGEYPESYDEYGKLVEAPAWIHGLKGARAGILIKADPQLGEPSHSQGWGPAVNFTDRAQVFEIGQQTCVAVGCYEDVLVMDEFSQEEPDALQLKYYARGVGNVQVGWQGEDATRETLELVEIIQLSPEAMAEVRAEALALEQRAYENSKEVYAQTSPAEALAANQEVQVGGQEGPTLEVVVYASDLPRRALSEFELWDNPDSPGGILVGTPNTGDELDPPPENDPHVEFNVQVRGGLPYRCWVHMKVGAPMGKSQANVLWVQFSDAVDQTNNGIFRPGTGSYLTAQGPAQEGWAWVGCDLADADPSQSLIYFRTSGEITVRLQAGMEGVGFDQFVLSPDRFLDSPPVEAVIEK